METLLDQGLRSVSLAGLPLRTRSNYLSNISAAFCFGLGGRSRALEIDQERLRGAALHRLVCATLGYRSYHDDGRFPDVRHQLLEVKLQTSPAIDLGLVRPDSIEVLDVPMLEGQQLRHCDVRYAIFYGDYSIGMVQLTHLLVVTGEGFFARFAQFQGKVLNRKLQIPLPTEFFDT